MMTLLVSLIVLLHFTNGLLKCEDGSGRVTDWWFAIRNEGSRTFEYFDSILEANLYAQDREEEEEDEDEDVDVLPDLPDLQFNHFDFNTHDNPIERLLKHVREEANNRYSRSLEISRTPPIPPPTTGYIAYSDQSSKVSKTEAHAKGFIAWELGVGANQWKGYWLIHSQPFWPYFEYPVSEYCAHGTDYPAYRKCSIQKRQSFFCVSLKTEQHLKQAIKQTEAMNVFIYDKSGARPAVNLHDPNAQNGMSFGGTLKHFFNGRRTSWGGLDRQELAVNKIRETYAFRPSLRHQWYWSGHNKPNGDEHSKIGFNKNPDAKEDGAAVFRNSEHVICVGDLNLGHHDGSRLGGFMCVDASHLHDLIKRFYEHMDRALTADAIDDNILEYEDNEYVEYEYQNDKNLVFEYVYNYYLSLLSVMG
eukprot:174935_1